MPTINPALVPTIAPGNLFTNLSNTDSSLSIRWLVASDPCYYSVLNRPMADLALRQLILAKTVDQLSINIGHQSMFPFLVQAKIVSGTEEIDVPAGWIWDLHFSTPTKWQNFRLAKIKRISGGQTTSTYDGTIRLIFTASQTSSTTEVALFSADYAIDSSLSYQRARLTVVDSSEETVYINAGEASTVGGFITFRTLDTTDSTVAAFFDGLTPGSNITDIDSDGNYDSPAVYHLANTTAGGTSVDGDYSLSAVNHGTGLLVDSVQNIIPQTDSDIQSWLVAFNYPFGTDCTRTSLGTSGVTIPSGMFREFSITAPAGDEPTNSTLSGYYPIWVNRIELVGTESDQLRFYFATHTVDDNNLSVDTIEFATLDLIKSMIPGQIVEIEPIDDLYQHSGSDDLLYQQHFGRGHVVLSSLWDGTGSDVDDFFDSFTTLPTGEVSFLQAATRLGSFAVDRVPKYIPTIGESRALKGTTSGLASPIPPSESNRYVTEQDQGLGDVVDFESVSGVTPAAAISRYGYTGSLAHRIVHLCIDHSLIPSGSEVGAGTFYDDEVLPRLTILLGRAPQFGDMMYTGTSFLIYNGDTWQSF